MKKPLQRLSALAAIFFGTFSLIPILSLAQTSSSGSVGQHLDAGDLGIDFIGPSNFNFNEVNISSPREKYNSYYLNTHTANERIQVHDGRYNGGFQLQVQSTDYVEATDATSIIPASNLAIVTEEGDSNNYSEQSDTPNIFTGTSAHEAGTAPGSKDGNGIITEPLPFIFVFYGEAYDHIFICKNGFLSFAANCSVPENTDILKTKTDIPRIVPYFKDLLIEGIFTQDNSNDPNPNNRNFKIHWKGSASGEQVEFDLILYRDNHIAFEYGNIADSSKGPAVGITKGDGVNFVTSVLNAKSAGSELNNQSAVFIAGVNAMETLAAGTPPIIAPLNGLAQNDNTYTNFLDSSTPLNALYAGACSNTQGRVGTYILYPSYKLHIPNNTIAGTYSSTVTWTVIDESMNCGEAEPEASSVETFTSTDSQLSETQGTPSVSNEN